MWIGCKCLQRLPDTSIAEDICSQSTFRSEEHTSELQSRQYLVFRLLLEKKKTSQGAPQSVGPHSSVSSSSDVSLPCGAGTTLRSASVPEHHANGAACAAYAAATTRS